MAPSASGVRRSVRKWWPWALAAVALLLAGLIIGRGDGSAERPVSPRSPSPRPAEPNPGPGDRSVPYPISARVPNGFAQTREGAVDAAVAYVTSAQALLQMDLDDAEEAVRVMAAASTADAQAEDVRSRMLGLRRALAGGTGPFQYWQAVLGTRVEEFSSVRARVSVWHVGVLSKAGVAPPQAGWAISVVDLVWEAADWRLEHETVSPGPTPILDASSSPASAEEFEAALVGFVGRDGR